MPLTGNASSAACHAGADLGYGSTKPGMVRTRAAVDEELDVDAGTLPRKDFLMADARALDETVELIKEVISAERQASKIPKMAKRVAVLSIEEQLADAYTSQTASE